MQELVGKTILSIHINEDQSLLTFKTNEGLISYTTEADCCSETWFADIMGVDALLNQVVTDVKQCDIDHDVDDGRSRQEVDEVYGYRLTTKEGYADIWFRNSSNGYYGGWINPCETHADNQPPIIKDWSA